MAMGSTSQPDWKVLASAYHEFTDKLAIMGNVGWQDWGSFGNIDVSIDSDTSTSATQDLGYMM
jgi:long-subunit fatty acid transport protein